MAQALPLGPITLVTKPKVTPVFSNKSNLCTFKSGDNSMNSSFPHPDLQSVCGFSCEDIANMFNELNGLNKIVRQLSKDLQRMVGAKGD